LYRAITLSSRKFPFVDRRVGRGDDEVVFLVGRQVVDLVGHLARDDLAVGRLDEAVLVDPGVGAHRGDEPDVRTFRRLDGAEASVVRVVHVADFEAGAFAGQSARSERERRRLWVSSASGLVWSMNCESWRRTEEGGDDRVDGAGVHQVLGRHLLGVAQRQALADGAAHAGEGHRELVGEELAHGTRAAVAQVVDVVDVGDGFLAVLVADLAVEEPGEVAHDGQEVFLGHGARLHRDFEVQAAVHAVAADLSQVVALLVEEHAQDQLAGGLRVGRIAGPDDAVDLLKRVLFAGGGIHVQRVVDDGIRLDVEVDDLDLLDAGLRDARDHVGIEERVGLDEDLAVGGDRVGGQDLAGQLVGEVDLRRRVEQREDLLVGLPADGAQQDGGGELAAAVDVDVHRVVDVQQELDPGSAVGDDAGLEEALPVGVEVLVERHARAAVQLAHHDALGAVDDEGAVFRQQGDVPEVDVVGDLLLELLLVALGLVDVEGEGGPQGGGVGHAALLALRDGVLGHAQGIPVVDELVVPLHVGDREGLAEDRFETLVRPLPRQGTDLQEPVEGFHLDL
jgi:hypothetical protein